MKWVGETGGTLANGQRRPILDDLGFIVEGTSNPSAPFVVTGFDYDQDADTVTLTWRKTAATSYIAKYSISMTDWRSDMGDGLTNALDENPDDGDQITVTFSLADFGIANEPELFFRIEEE